MRILSSLLVLISLPALAGPTAVISPIDELGLDVVSRDVIRVVLIKMGLEVLPRNTDPAKADVVLQVSGRKGKPFEMTAIVTPTGEKLATALGSDLGEAVSSLRARLKPALERLLKEGLPQVLSLRWTKRLSPDPALAAAAFFKQNGIKASPTLMQQDSAGFRFKTQKSPAAMKELLRDYFSAQYRITEEPPATLPRSPRTHMFLLRKK